MDATSAYVTERVARCYADDRVREAEAGRSARAARNSARDRVGGGSTPRPRTAAGWRRFFPRTAPA